MSIGALMYENQSASTNRGKKTRSLTCCPVVVVAVLDMMVQADTDHKTLAVHTGTADSGHS